MRQPRTIKYGLLIILAVSIFSVNVSLQNHASAEISEIPDWIKQTVLWWGSEVVSDQEFINALEYLIEKGIIQIRQSLPSSSKSSIDFNGDGFIDLAIGSPGETVEGNEGAGMTHVVYGSSSGLGVDNMDAQYLNQDLSLLTTNSQPNENFGAALTTGDFNGDGFIDLAIGSPGETVQGNEGAGMIHVVYGSSSGLGVDNMDAQYLNQDLSLLTTNSQPNENFGHSLAP